MHLSVFRGVVLFLSVFFLISCNQEEKEPELLTFQSPFESDIQLELIHKWKLNDPELFPNLTYFQFTGAGNLVVGDNSLLKLYLIDKEGNILQTHAGKGRGPGELNSLTNLATHPDGHIATADISNRIITVVNTNDESFQTTDFDPGWNTSLQWIDDKLIIINNPFGIRGRNIPSGSLIFSAYNPDSETIEELLVFELEMQNAPPEQISCTFCPFVFADDNSFFTVKNDTTYQFHKVDIQTGESESFVFSGLSVAVRYSESEHEAMRERNRSTTLLTGVDMSEVELPIFKRSFVKLFVDAEKRVWLQLSVHEDSRSYFDVFSEDGIYLGSVNFPENAKSATYLSQSKILFRFTTDDPNAYSVKLYSIK